MHITIFVIDHDVYVRLPIVWASSIITRARREGRIRDDFAVKTLIDELNKFRGKCGLLLAYDNISIPLVYTQVFILFICVCLHCNKLFNNSMNYLCNS